MFERCLYFNANRFARTVNRLWDDAYSEVGLAPAHAYLLRLVLAKPGLIQRDIADRLSLEKSTVTRFIDKLEKDGYLIRSARDEDRRIAIFPTTEAKQLCDRLDEINQELESAMKTLLGDRTVKDIVEVLGRASVQL